MSDTCKVCFSKLITRRKSRKRKHKIDITFEPYCHPCRMKSLKVRRKKLRYDLIEKFGGKCSVCGYDRCYACLAFHHRDPSTKKFELSSKSLGSRSMKSIEEESQKCILVCMNCHGEIHNQDNISSIYDEKFSKK